MSSASMQSSAVQCKNCIILTTTWRADRQPCSPSEPLRS